MNLSAAITFLLVGILLLFFGWYVIDRILSILLYVLGTLCIIVGVMFTMSSDCMDSPDNAMVHIGDAQASIVFTPVKGATFYTATSSPEGITAMSTESPIVVTKLTNGVNYEFTIKAHDMHRESKPKRVVSAIKPTMTMVMPEIRPQAPINVKAVPHEEGATVSFDSHDPLANSFTVYAKPGHAVATGVKSPIDIGGLVNGKEYEFTVVANHANVAKQHTMTEATFGSSGVSKPSHSATALLARPPRRAPTDIRAVRGKGQATISFKHVDDATSYSVVAQPDLQTETGESSPIIVTGLHNDRDYTFTVKAHNEFGYSASSDESNIVHISDVVSAPDAPVNMTTVPGDSYITILFNKSVKDLSYKATVSPGDHSVSETGSPIVIGGLTNGTSYTVSLVAVNENGESEPVISRDVVPVKDSTIPVVPSKVSAVPKNHAALVSFIESDGATMYTVMSVPGNNTTIGASSPILVSDLTNGTSYTFTVRATNDAGTSPESTASSPITPIETLMTNTTAMPQPQPQFIKNMLGMPPESPTYPVAHPANGSALIVFSESLGAISYTATSTPGNISATNTCTPIQVDGLVNGTSYTFTVTAANKFGTSTPSVVTNAVVPRI